ncbi:MAG: AAA family ATPase [Christensenellales bacterium]|jgi:RecA-family ATPase
MSEPLTLAQYAQQKGLKEDMLREWGLFGDARGVCIPYLDESGQRRALRWRLQGGDGPRFLWQPGAQPMPYGLWLAFNQQAKGLILCEGESDAHALWHMGLPGLGIPGAASFKTEWAACLRERPVWLHVENDAGGQVFVQRTVQRLRQAGYSGRICRFAASDVDAACKDISDLYLKLGHPRALEALRTALARHVPAEATQDEKPACALEAYEALSLYGAILPRPLMVLDNVLTAGLALLAGAPKKGKSWLALALGMAVAEGQPLFGRATRPGHVLYLDLESRQYRVQERLSVLRKGPPPQGLFIAHRAPRLGEGLLEELDSWMKQHPQTVLIIVDTLARVKGAGAGGENAYEADTRIWGTLQQFALDRGVCVLLVHHLRKSVGGREGDVYERVSGSTGLTGVCDCVLVLDGKRQKPEAMLYVDGRDIPPAQLALGFEEGRWQLLSDDGRAWQQNAAYDQSPLASALRHLMAAQDQWEGTASDLTRRLRETSNGAVDIHPRAMFDQLDKIAGLLHERDGVRVRRVRVGNDRVIRLERTPRTPLAAT